MDYWIWILFGVLIVWILWFKLHGRVNTAQAREYIKSGALVLDVRTEQEFAEKRLTGAVNLPLHEVTNKMSAIEPDKERVILCHCVSGGRSGIAMGRLRKMGYKQVYNLGSYGQAAAALQK